MRRKEDITTLPKGEMKILFCNFKTLTFPNKFSITPKSIIDFIL